MFITRTNIVGKSGPSIDGAGAAKEDESTGAVGAHRGMNVWRCRQRVGPPTRGRWTEVIAPPAAGAANAVESKMGRRKRCASDGGSGAESKCYDMRH